MKDTVALLQTISLWDLKWKARIKVDKGSSSSLSICRHSLSDTAALLLQVSTCSVNLQRPFIPM